MRILLMPLRPAADTDALSGWAPSSKSYQFRDTDHAESLFALKGADPSP